MEAIRSKAALVPQLDTPIQPTLHTLDLLAQKPSCRTLKSAQSCLTWSVCSSAPSHHLRSLEVGLTQACTLAQQDGLLIDSERLYTVASNELLAPYGKELTWEVRGRVSGSSESPAAT